MQLFPPLTGFYQAIEADVRISSTHISIYMALLQQLNLSGGKNPIEFERALIMKAAKINARQTYNLCMGQLHDYGYIVYKPAVNGFTSSQVFIKECEPKM